MVSSAAESASNMYLSPTGRQISLRRGPVTARIAQVGAALRELTVDGIGLVPPYPDEDPTPLCAGVVLVPWPSRIRDGSWTDGDVERQLAITDLDSSTAIHGLLRYTMYDVVDLSEDSVTFTAPVVPQMGYPYLLETAVTYSLTDDGLSVRHVLINRSRSTAPVAVGIHSFFTISDVDPDLLTLSVPADTYMVPDERLLPISEAPVEEGVDLREGLLIGDHALDFIYTSVDRAPDGWIRSTLSAPDGRRVTVRQGEGFDYVQVFTSDAFPGQRIATAIEPMTAPMDAFNTGRGVRRLQPGETWTVEWGVDFSR